MENKYFLTLEARKKVPFNTRRQQHYIDLVYSLSVLTYLSLIFLVIWAISICLLRFVNKSAWDMEAVG